MLHYSAACCVCGKNKPSGEYCVVHSSYHKLEKHHVARRENDPHFTVPVCFQDHHKYLTQWHETSGIEPGMLPFVARYAGTVQIFTAIFQERGFEGQMRIPRGLDSIVSSLTGIHDEMKWDRPRRVKEHSRLDIENLTQDVFMLMSELMSRQQNDKLMPDDMREHFRMATWLCRRISTRPDLYVKSLPASGPQFALALIDFMTSSCNLASYRPEYMYHILPGFREILHKELQRINPKIHGKKEMAVS